MAPEQHVGGPLTAAADVWALGAMLRELLIDRPGDAFDRACDRCLLPGPAGRHATAAELADELKRYLEEGP